MENDCDVCDGLKMIVTGSYMWILNEQVIEEDKWEDCLKCIGEKNGNNFCKNVSEKK